MFAFIVGILLTTLLVNLMWAFRLIHEANRAIAELDGILEDLINALAEDANADYQERVDKMFEFLTEELDED